MRSINITKDGKIFVDGKERKLSTHSAGYKVVRIDNKLYYIHRLVASQYIPNPQNKPEVNHINGIKDDNRVENLEWVSGKENMKHALKNGLLEDGLMKIRKLTTEDVFQIRKKYKPRKYTYRMLAKEYDVDYKTIWNCVNKKCYNAKTL